VRRFGEGLFSRLRVGGRISQGSTNLFGEHYTDDGGDEAKRSRCEGGQRIGEVFKEFDVAEELGILVCWVGQRTA